MSCVQESKAAAKFISAYGELKEKKEFDRLIQSVSHLILSAKSDGISDKELIEIINSLGFREKFYPAKLKELRRKLQGASGDEPSNEEGGESAEIPESVAPSPLSTALGLKA